MDDEILDYFVNNYSGRIFSSDDLKRDENLIELITKDLYNETYDENLCSARMWNNGYGGQCNSKKLENTCFCKKHSIEENRWCGLVTEKKPSFVIRPGGSGRQKKWKTDSNGKLVQKQKKTTKKDLKRYEKEKNIELLKTMFLNIKY